MKCLVVKEGKEVLLDDKDYEYVSKYRWYITSDGYAARSTYPNGACYTVMMHRHILNLERGNKMQVDHINGNRLDNRRNNLRLCTPYQNSLNKKREVRNTSGFKGVSFHKVVKKWTANIKVKGKNHYLGCYESPESAYEAYCEAAKRLHGEFANIGQPIGIEV